MAGIIPGILMGLALVVVVMLEVRRNHVMPSNVEKASAKERWNAFKDAFWGFLMPIIILGGIYGGFFTPTEAAPHQGRQTGVWHLRRHDSAG